MAGASTGHHRRPSCRETAGGIRGDTSLSCSGTPSLSFELEATGIGVMSCRELYSKAADEIAQRVRSEIRTFTGR